MTTKLEIVSSVSAINEKDWDLKTEKTNSFLKTGFLKIFENHSSINSVLPIYITTKKLKFNSFKKEFFKANSSIIE